MKDKVKFTVNLTSEIAERVDSYASKMGINRTAATSVLLSMALDGQKAMQDLGKLVGAIEEEKRK